MFIIIQCRYISNLVEQSGVLARGNRLPSESFAARIMGGAKAARPSYLLSIAVEVRPGQSSPAAATLHDLYISLLFTSTHHNILYKSTISHIDVSYKCNKKNKFISGLITTIVRIQALCLHYISSKVALSTSLASLRRRLREPCLSNLGVP